MDIHLILVELLNNNYSIRLNNRHLHNSKDKVSFREILRSHLSGRIRDLLQPPVDPLINNILSPVGLHHLPVGNIFSPWVQLEEGLLP